MATDRPPDARPVDAASAAAIEAITVATVTAFEELCQTPLVPGEPYLTRTSPATDRVTAEITLRRAVPGRLLLTIPRPVLDVLVRRYLPDDVAITPEIADDTAGEFANVIAGQTKTMLKGTLYHFHLSTPRVGSTLPPADAEFVVVPFDSDSGGFAVHIHLPPCEETATAG